MLCTIAWVKAHVGQKEMMQQMKQKDKGRKNSTLQVLQMPIPVAQAKTIIDEAIRKEWKRKWTIAPYYKHTRLF